MVVVVVAVVWRGRGESDMAAAAISAATYVDPDPLFALQTHMRDAPQLLLRTSIIAEGCGGVVGR